MTFHIFSDTEKYGKSSQLRCFSSIGDYYGKNKITECPVQLSICIDMLMEQPIDTTQQGQCKETSRHEKMINGANIFLQHSPKNRPHKVRNHVGFWNHYKV